MSNTKHNRLGVNTQAWREFCRAEQLLAQRDALLAALQNLVYAENNRHNPGFRPGEAGHVSLGNLSTEVRSATAKATKE
jgi:hypothetical protein